MKLTVSSLQTISSDDTKNEAPEDPNSFHSISAKWDNNVCTFSFQPIPCSTLTPKIVEQQKPVKEVVKAKDLLDKINGQCIAGSFSPFVYKFCIGNSVIQTYAGGSSSDDYNLGNFDKIQTESAGKDSHTHFYTNGDACGAAPRRSDVTFMCGDEDAVASVVENTMCVYKIIVTHRSLCGSNSPFERFKRSESTSITKDKKEDVWMLSLEPIGSKAFICSAYITKNGAVSGKPSVCFNQFSISINNNEDNFSLKTEDFVARHRNRLTLQSTELIQNSNSALVKSSGNFKPSDIEYIRLQASTKN